MSDRPRDDTLGSDDARPGSDPGAAYEDAADEGEVEQRRDAEEKQGPDAGDVYRSGS